MLNYRLLGHGLNQLDAGGGGDCFFKSVSHQLCGDSHHHLEIRSAGIQYMRDNSEQFIDSVLDSPWSQYIPNMSGPGTWADSGIATLFENLQKLSKILDKVLAANNGNNVREL